MPRRVVMEVRASAMKSAWSRLSIWHGPASRVKGSVFEIRIDPMVIVWGAVIFVPWIGLYYSFSLNRLKNLLAQMLRFVVGGVQTYSLINRR